MAVRTSAIIAACALLMAPSLAWAEGAKDLVGTWMIKSIVGQANGQPFDAFGPSPRAVIMFDGKMFSIVIAAQDLPKFQSGNRITGTAEEYRAVAERSLSYFGAYTATDDGTLTLHIAGSSFSNWAGTDQPRTFKINGDTIVLGNPASSTGRGAVVVTAERAR